jgi:hypothetical protein
MFSGGLLSLLPSLERTRTTREWMAQLTQYCSLAYSLGSL